MYPFEIINSFHFEEKRKIGNLFHFFQEENFKKFIIVIFVLYNEKKEIVRMYYW